MKDIKGFEGLYAATEEGQIWSYRTQRFLKTADNGHGYLYVSLTKDGIKKCYRVNRLIAETFIPNPENLPVVDHKDRNRKNNNMNNLQWVSYQDNLKNGALKGHSKLRVPVRCVETGEIYNDCADAERQTGIGRYNINNTLNGKQKTAGGYHWERIIEED